MTGVDLNSTTTSYTDDLMLRPSSISTPGGGSQTFAYSFGPSSPYTSVSTLHATGGSYITAKSDLDPYGRLIETDTTDTPTDDLVVYAYDADGNLDSVSNPYRSGGTVANTTYVFDATCSRDQRSKRMKIVMAPVRSRLPIRETQSQPRTRREISGKLSPTALAESPKCSEPNSSGSLTLETDSLYGQNVVVRKRFHLHNLSEYCYSKGRGRFFLLANADIHLRYARTKDAPNGSTVPLKREQSPYTYPNGSGSCAGIATLVCSSHQVRNSSTSKHILV